MIERSDDADAFLREDEGVSHSDDDLAEIFGEEFVRACTSGGDAGDDLLHQMVVAEEFGGPFVETSGAEEFAHESDQNGRSPHGEQE